MAHELMVTWLKRAHAMEESLSNTLAKHAEQAAEFPDIQARIEQHRQETEDQANRIQQRVEELGGDVSETRARMSEMMGSLQGMVVGAGEDRLVQNAMADYAAEHYEIAAYHAIIQLARDIDDEQTATMAESILKEEVAMADWLRNHIPETVQAVAARHYQES